MTEKLLYDIVQLFEWPKEEIKVEVKQQVARVRATYEFILSSYKRVFHLLKLAGLPYKQANSQAIVNALYEVRTKQKWIFSVCPNSIYIAILQTHKLEIRYLNEDLTLAGSHELLASHAGQDAITWNDNSTLVAVAFSTGKVLVLDVICTVLCSFELNTSTGVPDEFSYNIVSIMIMPVRNMKDLWHSELLILLNSGLLLNFYLSKTGEHQLFHTYNFGNYYFQGITSAAVDFSSRLLIIGGNVYSGNINEKEVVSDDFGLTKWRILSGYPYYKKDLGESTSTKGHSGRNILRKAYGYATSILQKIYSTPINGVFNMRLSPDQNNLIAVHFNGSLSLWSFPSLKLKHIWLLDEQPCYNETNPSLSSRFGRKRLRSDYLSISSFPFDISWWNNDSVIISRCSGCLTILSVTGSDLINMFGNQCEWVTPCCQITSAYQERFYLLESHNSYSKSSKRMKLSNEEDDDDDGDGVDEEDDDKSLVQKGMNFLNSFTSTEQFKSKDKNYVSKYALLTLTKTTPQELYERKLNDKEFGEALSIAQAYNLDCDKVFQRQWRNASVTRASIQDYLSKVKNRLWVFRECTDRVPLNLDDMKELIEFALRITDIDKLAVICNNTLDSNFQVQELEDYEGFDYNLQQQREIEKRLHFEKEWSQHVDFQKLSLEQSEMIKCRQRVLKYKDRLSTFILLHGGHDAANEKYTADIFADFRKRDLFELALEYAHTSKWESVDTLFQYHSDQLKQHWLPLLSNFPETMPPNTYKCLLPKIEDGQVIGLLKSQHRPTVDWCEKMKGWHHVLATEEFYEIHKELKQFRNDQLSAELVRIWYEYRAKEIEKFSHLTEEALSLLEIGIENGVSGLSELQFNLKTLDNLLFECNCDLAMTLEELLKKSPLERIRLMMAKSLPTTYVQDIQLFVIPFVRQFGQKNLFQDYLLEVAQKDLVLPFVVFKHIFTNDSASFCFKDTNHVIETALNCIYAKKEANQFDIAHRMLKCLPKPEEVDKLTKDKIKFVEETLNCCNLLAKHKQLLTSNELRDLAQDKKQIAMLFKRLTRSLTREKVLTSIACTSLLDDLNVIASKIFSDHIDNITCVRILIESLLASGLEDNIRLAGDMMVRSQKESQGSRAGKRLPYQESVSLVLSASQEYFDAASIHVDDNKLLQVSRLCLLLITDHPPVIQEQMNLIEAVVQLSAFRLEMLPLEVRLSKDRLEIVKKVLDLSPLYYLKIESILRLSNLLCSNTLSSDELKGRTLCMIATKAFQNDDIKTATSVVRDLMSMHFSFCWKLCAKVATSREIADFKLKYDCIRFACAYCNDDQLTAMSQLLRTITASYLEQDLEEEMMRMEEEEDSEKLEGPQLVPSLIPASYTLKTSAMLLAGTVQATTGVIRSGLSMLKSADRNQFVKPFLSSDGAAEKQKIDFEKQSCPAFYRSIIPSADNDLYERISTMNISDSHSFATHQQRTMLRISALVSMHDRMNENLKSLAVQALVTDLPLGLAYLLSLPETSLIDECFRSLPFTSLSQQLQVYIHTLQVLAKQFQVTPNCISIYRAPPLLLIENALKHCYNSGSTDSLHRAVNSLVTFVQSERLFLLDQDIDMARCKVDSDYVQDTVQGLAMTTNEEQLHIAILLADQKSCDIWQVVLAHVEYLFTETDEPANDQGMLDRLEKLKIMPLLIDRAEELYDRFDLRVFPLLDGRKHSTLRCYFRLLKKCFWNGADSFKSSNDVCFLTPQQHLSYLEQISEFAPNLDYKTLVSRNSSNHIVKMIEEHLNLSNISMFSNLIPIIPYENEPISKDKVILCWLRKNFWSDQNKLTTEEEWIKRLESTGDWLQELNVKYSKLFFEDLLYSQKSVEYFSYKLRSNFLKFAIKIIKKRITQEKGSSNFNEYKNELESLRSHFNVFFKPFMKDVIKSSESDLNKREFLRKFDESRSQLDRVVDLAVQQMYNSVQFTKKFLSVLPHLKLSYNQILKHCTADLVTKLSSARDVSSRQSALTFLDRLLASISSLDDKEKKNSFDQVVSSIQDLCDADSVDISLKIDVLQLLRKSAALTSSQAEFLLYHRTSELVQLGWGENAVQELMKEIESICDESFQQQLVTSLHDLGKSLSQLKHLSSIVDLLTKDSSTNAAVSNQMWLNVLTAFTEHSTDGGEEIVNEAKKRQFLPTVSFSVFEAMSSKSLILHAVKFALITNISTSDDKIHNLLHSVKEIDSTSCDDELLRLLIDKNMLISTLSTLYYHRAIQYLTSENYENADEKVDSLVRQLQDSGYISEAATLLLRYRGSHTGFATFGSSISLISNWLKKL